GLGSRMGWREAGDGWGGGGGGTVIFFERRGSTRTDGAFCGGGGGSGSGIGSPASATGEGRLEPSRSAGQARVSMKEPRSSGLWPVDPRSGHTAARARGAGDRPGAS